MKKEFKETFFRSISVALAIFFASAPVLFIVTSMMTKAGFNSSFVFPSVAISSGLVTIIASFWCRLPLIFGPGIAGVSYLAIHLGVEQGWPVPVLVMVSLGATLLYFLAWLANGPSKMLQVLGPVLSRAITAMLGVFLIRLTIEAGYQEWVVTQGHSWKILGIMVLLWGIPVAVIEWAQRRSSAFSYLLGMAVCYFLNYILGLTQETGIVFGQNQWQGAWPGFEELCLVSGALSSIASACLGLWLIQTIDVAGCSAAMLSLSKGKAWAKNDDSSARKIQIMAPIGNLLGFLTGASGYSGPHCLHLSSAIAFCSQAPLFPRFVGFFVGVSFIFLACLGSLIHCLPLYIATPVILWVSIAMLRQLPLSIKNEGNEVVAGVIMVLSMALSCDIALSMAFGFWIALIIRWNSKQKICLASWIMAICFLMYIYLVR